MSAAWGSALVLRERLGASSEDRWALSPWGLHTWSPGAAGTARSAGGFVPKHLPACSSWFSRALAVRASQVEWQEQAPCRP